MRAALAAILALAWGGPALADGLQQEPLARFEAPLCPGVIGLAVSPAEHIVGRIRSHAERLGLRLGDPASCEPNLVIAFLADGQDYLQRLLADRPWLFTTMTTAERNALMAETGPARAWHVAQVRTRDGMQVGERESLDEPPQATMWSAHSRIYRPVRRDITSAMVLFDREAVRGRTLDQLADYAALRSLADTYPEAAADGEGSILALFDAGAAAPAGLTALDQAFLDRLYGGIPNLPASARLNGLPGEAPTIKE